MSEQLDRQVAATDGVDDAGNICTVTLTDTTSANLDDRKFPGFSVALPEKVHAEADVFVRIQPAALIEMVANDHMQVSCLVEFETEHGAELEWLVVLDLPSEGQANAVHLAQLAVHTDNHIGFVGFFEDVSLDDI